MKSEIKTSNNKIEMVWFLVCQKKNQNSDFDGSFTNEEINKFAIYWCKFRYQVKDEVNTSDLCLAAAKHLISKLKWEINSIDGIILLTQTPDYKLPASAFKIHKLLVQIRYFCL